MPDKQTPGALQLGQTTGSDTLYTDIGEIRPPIGNQMIIPLKVWRNCLRSNVEAYVPDIRLDAGMQDDRIQAAVLAALTALSRMKWIPNTDFSRSRRKFSTRTVR